MDKFWGVGVSSTIGGNTSLGHIMKMVFHCGSYLISNVGTNAYSLCRFNRFAKGGLVTGWFTLVKLSQVELCFM